MAPPKGDVCRLTLFVCFLLAASACGPSSAADAWEPSREVGGDDSEVSAVGYPTDFDPGPPASSGWAELFAQTPNYRAVSHELAAQWLAVDPSTGKSLFDATNEALAAQGKPLIPRYTLTDDKFRFEMGPVFYRGRLDGTARVLVVGQDAATDEALVHRAFIGGTGQKVQNFLNSVGITQSYLCVNTFIYSIYGQFDPFAEALATQGPIQAHRNQVFDHAFATSPIRLILSFGNAAHTSVQQYLDERYGGQLPPGVLWVRMLHPGMAGASYDPNDPTSGADELQAVISSFTSGWWRVWNAKRANSAFLPADPGGRTTQASSFSYRNASIPYRDLPFGAPRVLGRGGTMSERGGAVQVQLRSPAAQRYGAPPMPVPSSYKWNSGYQPAGPEDLAWEPPKFDAAHRFDPGPSKPWVWDLVMTPKQAVLGAEAGLDGGVPNDFEQPVWYRGRADGTAHVLVLAQDTSTDSFVAGRALTGDDGQKLNHFLARVGAQRDYLLLNVYPYPTGNLDAATVSALAQTPTLTAHRNKLIARALKSATVVLSFGEDARLAFAPFEASYPGTVLHLPHPKDPAAPLAWNDALVTLAPLADSLGLSGGDFTPYVPASFRNVRTQVPREDLPYGAPLWLGTSGDLSQQSGPSWLFWHGPRWVSYEP